MALRFTGAVEAPDSARIADRDAEADAMLSEDTDGALAGSAKGGTEPKYRRSPRSTKPTPFEAPLQWLESDRHRPKGSGGPPWRRSASCRGWATRKLSAGKRLRAGVARRQSPTGIHLQVKLCGQTRLALLAIARSQPYRSLLPACPIPKRSRKAASERVVKHDQSPRLNPPCGPRISPAHPGTFPHPALPCSPIPPK